MINIIGQAKSFVNPRFKRNLLLSKERKVECLALWNDKAAYWKPEYDIPQYCFSKILYKI